MSQHMLTPNNSIVLPSEISSRVPPELCERIMDIAIENSKTDQIVVCIDKYACIFNIQQRRLTKIFPISSTLSVSVIFVHNPITNVHTIVSKTPLSINAFNTQTGVTTTLVNIESWRYTSFAINSDLSQVVIISENVHTCINTYHTKISTEQSVYPQYIFATKIPNICYSPDNTRIAHAGINNTVCVRDAQTGAYILQLQGHTRDTIKVYYNKTGTKLISFSTCDVTLVSGQWDNNIRIWDANTGECLKVLNSGETFVNRPKKIFMNKDETLMAVRVDYYIHIWDLTKDVIIYSIEVEKDNLFYRPELMIFFTKENNLVTMRGKEVFIHNIHTHRLMCKYILTMPVGESIELLEQTKYLHFNL